MLEKFNEIILKLIPLEVRKIRQRWYYLKAEND